MAVEEREKESNAFDSEAPNDSQNSLEPPTRIVNAVPGSSPLPERYRRSERHSSTSDSMSPMQLHRNGGMATDSANTTEGFSLADDAEDSLGGSESHSDGTKSQSLSGPSTPSIAATPSTQRGEQKILLPFSYRIVKWSRRMFWLLWVVGTVTVTTTLWAMATREWENHMMDVEAVLATNQDLEQNFFDSQVMYLQQLWKSRLEFKLNGMETVGKSITSEAVNEGMDWPFATFPDFSTAVATWQGFSFWMPLVQGGSDDLDAIMWGNYSQEQLDVWLYKHNTQRIGDVQRWRYLHDFPGNYSGEISDEIFQTGPDGRIPSTNTTSPFFFPIWQHANPIVPSLINYDLLSHQQLGPSLQAVMESKRPVLSRTFLKSDVAQDDFFLSSTLVEDSPTIFLFYPIFEQLKWEEDEVELKGILASALSWNDILAADSVPLPALHVDIPTFSCSNEKNESRQAIMVELTDHRNVTVLGENSVKMKSRNPRHNSFIDLTADLQYYGQPLLLDIASDACGYVLQVLQDDAIQDPGSELEDDNHVPINIVIGTLTYASVIALAFIYFDSKVRQRDRALTHEATRSRNIVASLFPPQFHDRLFQSNAIPQSEDFQRVFHGVEAAMSSHFDLPLESEDHSNFEVPLTGESDSETKDIAKDNDLQQDIETSSIKLRSYSDHQQQCKRRDPKRVDRLSQSAHCKPGTSSLMGSIPKPSSFRTLRRISGGNGAEPSTPERCDNNDGNPQNASTKPSFGRDFLSRASSMRNMRQIMGAETLTMGRSDHASLDAVVIAKDEPIADLFPEATVMFADISGFTAWSSAREPAQVFKLLETVYRSFDRIARKRRVFKVETIGDCYMAVTGVPDSQPDHALIMAQFAKECMIKMREVTRKLEATLGPETGDLCMRFGLHSGPVTAGVLRGEKSRFQLFGDTVNFASRMESTGRPNRIQASRATADLLIEAGKTNWVQPRDEIVHAKGKGQVQTFWIFPRSTGSSSSSIRSLDDSVGSIQGSSAHRNNGSDSLVQLKTRTKRIVGDAKTNSLHSTGTSDNTFDSSRRTLLSISHHSQVWAKDQRSDEHLDEGYDGFEDDGRQERLIDWNVKILASILSRIQASRPASVEEVTQSPKPRRGRRIVEPVLVYETKDGETAFDEVTEVIPMAKVIPQTDQRKSASSEDADLPIKVERQLKDYVSTIAFMYRDNFFHNFEHASHVLMSSQKLLQRVISADKNGESATIIEHASIIASDPLTQFAIVFAALIHDVDHTGVPNSQLVREKAHVAALYKNRSIAEQNSLDLAWDLLMSREYHDLQRAIFANQEELQRFRQLIVNVVLATDIFDPDMVKVRNSRWEKAFGDKSTDSELSEENIRSLKATIVIEYIMQASDVSHTMQHWHVYVKWNERLFEEMYSAFQVGRGEKDPSLGWYKGELWFFDNYVIPLAKKLKDCEVFGAASSQFLKYALDNREEWETKGEEIVASFVQKHSKPL